MDLKLTQFSLDLVRQIAKNVPTFHHHYHVLYDVANTFGEKKINYVEIGAYAGASSCLMSQRLNTSIISIDLGEPIPKSVVLRNVLDYKYNNNYYKYIQGNSQLIETKTKVFEALIDSTALGYDNGIDMLFIDGDHSFNGVLADFEMYKDLVNVGGYIIFDDYNDNAYSPEVKQAVDSLLPSLEEYEIIGALDNTLGAYPSELKEGNCFIIKRIK
jgi:predicted O-methyltransferase YrrM